MFRRGGKCLSLEVLVIFDNLKASATPIPTQASVLLSAILIVWLFTLTIVVMLHIFTDP
jgi:hypothetical protein